MAMNKEVSGQTVSLLYLAPADSRRINLRHQNVRQVGIYEGMYLSDAGGGNITLSRGVCEISDGTYQVRVATTSSTTAITPANGEYVILRWIYGGDREGDVLNVYTVITPLTNDVIVAKVVTANPLSLDYGDADYPRTQPNTLDLFLKVVAPDVNDSNQMKPRVRAGRIQTPTGVVDIDDQSTSSAFTHSGGGSTEYGLVYIDTSGAVQIVDANGNTSVPAYGGKMVLAQIAIASTTAAITQSMITDVRDWLCQKRKDYLVMFNNTPQVDSKAIFTKVSLGTVVKRLGIAAPVADVITLEANKMYCLSYNICFNRKTSEPVASDPEVYAMWRVVSGDTGWGFGAVTLGAVKPYHIASGTNVSFAHHELGTVADNETCSLSMTNIIIPSEDTTIQLEARTTDPPGQNARVLQTSISIWTL